MVHCVTPESCDLTIDRRSSSGNLISRKSNHIHIIDSNDVDVGEVWKCELVDTERSIVEYEPVEHKKTHDDYTSKHSKRKTKDRTEKRSSNLSNAGDKDVLAGLNGGDPFGSGVANSAMSDLTDGSR